jgi:hypothetical protein
MTVTNVSPKTASDSPVALQLSRSVRGSRVSLKARWQDDAANQHELLITVDSANEAECLEEMLRFCYDAGFADASNPRLFMP